MSAESLAINSMAVMTRHFPLPCRRYFRRHRDGGARVEGRLDRWLVRRVLVGSIVYVPLAPKPRLRSLLHAPRDVVKLVASGWPCRMEEHASRQITCEHAVEHCDVEVDVQVEARPESLHE